MTGVSVRTAGTRQIRRYYENLKMPMCSAARARADVFALLEERKSLQRAGEALVAAALPYTGDPAVKKAVDNFRALLAGTRNESR